ncbi:MAG TPA: apolipoprotein N-acyltransferase [Vicinamibacterales bacterium]|nr:apolipoprotein N-acyltransferase [Vicinamibacterales bacterium]
MLLVFSFPKFGHPAIAWIALTPLLVALTQRPSTSLRAGVSMLRAFLLGLVTGGIYLGGTLYWLSMVMQRYGSINIAGAVVINALFVAYLALYPAIFAAVMRRLAMAFGVAALAVAPFVWTATELGRMYVFTGFPWVLLGYSQATVLPVAQAASIVGVFGLSAIVVSVSAALAGIVVARAWRPAATVAAGVLLIAVWGNTRARNAQLTREGQPLRVGIVQPNTLEEERENTALAQKIFWRTISLAHDALVKGDVGLVVMPESSISPYTVDDYPDVAAALQKTARESNASLLVGSDQYQWHVVNGRREPEKSFNSAFMIRPDGTTGAVYRKIHLVPWGEYVPLKDWLTFVGPLVQAIGRGFDAGDELTLLPLGQHEISTAICYEIIYPDLVRRFVDEGSELLTTITNDSWFGATSAPYQHFEQAAMRAIEEGRYLVRSANTGISGIVDPYGHVLERSNIFDPEVLVGEVRLLKVRTPYSLVGDVFAYASAVLTIALLLMAWRSRLRTED